MGHRGREHHPSLARDAVPVLRARHPPVPRLLRPLRLRGLSTRRTTTLPWRWSWTDQRNRAGRVGRPMAMLTRRDTLRILGVTGLVAPALTACGDRDGSDSATDPAGMRLVSADVARSAGDARAIPDVVSAMGAFAGDLWSHLAPADQNLALSPYSIAVALAMTANGAAGATQTQMLDVLHIRSLATYNGGTAALTRSLEALAGQVDLADGKTADDRPRQRGPAVRRRGDGVRSGVPQRARQGVRRGDADRGLPARRGGLPHADQRLDGAPDPRSDPDDPASGLGGPEHPAGAGQRAVLQGTVADAVREGRDHAAGLPSRGRLPRRRTDDAGGARRREVPDRAALARRPVALRRQHPRHDGRAARRGARGRRGVSPDGRRAHRRGAAGVSRSPCRAGPSAPRPDSIRS